MFKKSILNQMPRKSKKLLLKGPADDARNTDNAWMETTAIDFHDSEGVLEDLDQHGTGIGEF